MNRLRTTLTAAGTLTALLATTAAGCGSDGTPQAGRTIVAAGTGAPVSCKQLPYDMALGEQEADGTGIVVQRGYVRGAIWVSCTGVPSSFAIVVQLKRNGLLVGTRRTYTGIPTAVGYAATVFEPCTPGVYRVQYTYRWKAHGAVATDTTTTPISETVTDHDCDN